MMKFHKEGLLAIQTGVLLVAFLAGRWSAPEKVRKVEVVKTVEVAKETSRDTTAESTDRSRSRRTATRRTETEVHRPDGTTERTETTEDVADERDREIEVRYVDRVVEKVVAKVVEKRVEKVVERGRPRWQLGLMAGVGLDPAIDLAGPLVLGAQASVRLLGPLRAGAWATTNGAAGGQVLLEF